MTFSSTVISRKICRFWNVRAMPSLARRKVGKVSIRTPSNRIAPDVGRVTPAIMLNSVLLPAPFGPITALISPGPNIEAEIGHRARPRRSCN